MIPDSELISQQNKNNKKTLIIVVSVFIFFVLLASGIGIKIYLTKQKQLIQQKTIDTQNIEPQSQIVNNLRIDTSESYSIGGDIDETLVTGGTVVEHQVEKYLKIIGVSPDAKASYKVYCTITPKTIIERVALIPNPNSSEAKNNPLIEQVEMYLEQISTSSQVRVEINYDKDEMNYESTGNICLNIGLFN